MKRLFVSLALFVSLFVSPALAQTYPGNPPDADVCIGQASGPCQWKAMSGDAALADTGAVTVSKANGVAFATLATKASPVCSDLTNAAASCSTDTTNAANISSGTLANARLATATTADWEADTAGKLMTTDQVWGAGAFATITFGATTTIDLSTLVNGTITLTGNITTLNWNNCKAGQTGVIEFIQDATGSRTVPAAWNSSFRWAGGARGTLSTTGSAVDWLFYQCKSASVAFVSLQKGLAN